MAPVLKTGVPERVPGVRIPPSPPVTLVTRLTSFFTTSLNLLLRLSSEHSIAVEERPFGQKPSSPASRRSDRQRQAFLLQTCIAIHGLAGSSCYPREGPEAESDCESFPFEDRRRKSTAHPTTSSHQSQCWKRAEETVGTLDGETDVQGVVMWPDATAGIRWVRTCPRLIKHSPFLNWRIQYPISTRQFVQISSFALRTSWTSQLRLGLKLHSNGHRLWNYYCLIASPL